MFTTSYDYGCLYSPEAGNKLGNVVTYLIPKDFLFFKKHAKYIKEGEYDSLEDYVNNMNINDLKKTFDIYVFLIDKKYLKHTPELDSSYNVVGKYETDLYFFQNKINSWIKIDTHAGDEDVNWKNNFLSKKTEGKRKVFLDSIANLKIDDSWYKDYSIWLESYEAYYNYNYLVRVSKDSSYITERYLKDFLVPYQSKDTLFLFFKESQFKDLEYNKNKHIPEVAIVKVDTSYYVNSSVFDLKNSISNKPSKYGFLVDEIIEN